MIIVIPTTTSMEEILAFWKKKFFKPSENFEINMINSIQYLIIISSNIYQKDQRPIKESIHIIIIY